MRGRKKWFLNLNCTKCLLLNFAQKWFFKNFLFISDKNIRDHLYIREINSPPHPKCASAFFIFSFFRNSQITKFECSIWWFFKRSWLKEFPVFPITPHKVLISKRLEVEYISYCLFISKKNQYKSIKNSPL